MRKKIKSYLVITLLIVYLFSMTGCSFIQNEINELRGEITGNTYSVSFFSNDGNKFMDMSGQKINLESNIVREQTYHEDSGWGYTQTLSSVVTVTIDGKEVESCGSTMIFAECGLEPDVNFNTPEVIDSTADGLGDNVLIASTVNRYKNYFGKSRVVIIQSQLGNPICAYSGNDVYWKVCEDLPKTTKLMIDGKALYIHRANFQIIDKELLK